MKIKLILVLLALVSVDVVFGQGCSQCRMLAEQSNEVTSNDFGSNINSGILYLMAFPYAIIMFIFRKPIIRFVKGLRAKKA